MESPRNCTNPDVPVTQRMGKAIHWYPMPVRTVWRPDSKKRSISPETENLSHENSS